jgi:hypothetical protein
VDFAGKTISRGAGEFAGKMLTIKAASMARVGLLD